MVNVKKNSYLKITNTSAIENRYLNAYNNLKNIDDIDTRHVLQLVVIQNQCFIMQIYNLRTKCLQQFLITLD